MAVVVFGTSAVWGTHLVFSVADVVYAARGSWLPRDWALAQLVLSTLNIGASAVCIHYSHGYAPLEAEFGVSIGYGAWLVAHSLLSLYLYKDEEVADETSRIPSFAFGPTAGGAAATLRWTF